jgi:hypothetical protein
MHLPPFPFKIQAVRYLTGENLKVVLTEFFTLRLAVLFQSDINARLSCSHL